VVVQRGRNSGTHVVKYLFTGTRTQTAGGCGRERMILIWGKTAYQWKINEKKKNPTGERIPELEAWCGRGERERGEGVVGVGFPLLS